MPQAKKYRDIKGRLGMGMGGKEDVFVYHVIYSCMT